jgi:hypothetical protein
MVTEMYMEPNEEQKRAVRAAARERKRKQRNRDKQQRIRLLEAQQAAAERAERRRRNLLCYGECTAGRNADTLGEELMIHRQFLRALGEPDVCDGETLRSISQRTYQAWINGPFASRDGRTIYVPAFNGTTQQFDPDFGYELDDIPFDELWSPPNGFTGNEIIDVNNLPTLPNLPKAPVKVEPAPEETTAPTPSLAPVVPQQQPTAASFSWIVPHAHAYLTGNGGA